MLNKLKEIGSTPITWKAYGKLTLVALIGSLLMWLPYLWYWFGVGDSIKDWWTKRKEDKNNEAFARQQMFHDLKEEE